MVIHNNNVIEKDLGGGVSQGILDIFTKREDFLK